MGETKRFVSFLVTGGIAAGVNIAACWVFDFAVSYEVAIGLAYLVGMATAFVLARMFVFDPTGGRAHWQFMRFAIVNAVAFAQVWIVSVALDHWLFPIIGFTFQPETVAHVIGVLSPVASSYILHKRFSFRREDAAPDAGPTEARSQNEPGNAVAPSGLRP
jgi:putative flippase GtrA